MSLSRVQFLRLVSLRTIRSVTQATCYSTLSEKEKQTNENYSRARNVALVVGAGALIFGGISAKLRAEAAREEKRLEARSVELVEIR